MDGVPPLYYVSLDLGQIRDYTALVIMEEQLYIDRDWHVDVLYKQDIERGIQPGWVSPTSLSPYQVGVAMSFMHKFGRPADVPLIVTDMFRFPLGTSYADVVAKTASLVGRHPISTLPSCLLLDRTGVGIGVTDMFTAAGVGSIGITIHGGDAVRRDPQRPGYRVPKRDLVMATQVLLDHKRNRLKIVPAAKEADTIRKELQGFKWKIDPKTAHDSYAHWREKDHDDLVLAVAQAAWFRTFWNRHVDTQLAKKFERTRQLSEAMLMG